TSRARLGRASCASPDRRLQQPAPAPPEIIRNALSAGFLRITVGALKPARILSMSEPTYEELKAQLAALQKQSGQKRSGTLDFRVGEKGGVSVYGLGRFPVTLYYEQWIRLLGAADELKKFLEEQKSEGKLKLKEG